MTPITNTPTVPIAGQSLNSSDTSLTTTATKGGPSASYAVPDSSPTASVAVTVPPITPEAHLARVAQIFGPGVETIRLTDDRSHGEFLDDIKSVAVFEEPIIAVPCGVETGLCAVAFSCDRFAQMDLFIDLNRWTCHTVITYWRDVKFIWLRLDGFRPSNQTALDCRFISEGLVPVADLAGAGSQGEFPAPGQAIQTINCSDIRWPQIEMQETFLLQRPEHEHGKLIQVLPGGRVEVGVATAASFTATQLGLKYSYATDGFTMAISGEVSESLDAQRLHELISGWLTSQAIRAGVPLQVDEPVSAIIAALKVSCGIAAPAGFRMFVAECIERKVGASASTLELLTAYRAFCARRGTAVYSGRDFYKQFAVSAAEKFSVRRSHDLMRPKPGGGLTARCGYRNLAVKCPDASPLSDPSDGSDAS